MNALIAQCGGPTAVINTTLAAVVGTLRTHAGVTTIFGSRYGMQGLVRGDLADLTGLTGEELARLAEQPGAALGSSRYRPADDEMPAIVDLLRARGVGALFLVGGNGTMAAAARIHTLAAEQGVACQVIGIPKTIDNDLAGTEVTPGYGSAARYVAQTTREVGLDLRSMRGFEQVAVLEIMGRHAGWLAAASALARAWPGDLPHLILLPETPIDVARVLAAIEERFRADGVCLVVASEGVRNIDGAYLAELQGTAASDASGQRIFSLASGAAAYLAERVTAELGLRCRPIRPSTIQRASAALASPADRLLARQVGEAAVDAWQHGLSGVMMSIRRRPIGWAIGSEPLAAAQQGERHLPARFYNAATFDVTPAFLDYAAPLVEPLPPAPILF